MIGSDEMSSTSMDISETFRPEDLSKTDFFDFVTAPDMGIGIGVNDRPPGSNDTNGTNDQPLQGYDQFWGSDKDQNRLESAIFEDLDRYCWQQQQSQHPSSTNPSSAGSSISQAPSIVGGLGNTDGQIYTLTVLNGNEPWLKRDPDAPIAPTLDLDSLLGSFPGYVKSEFVYEDSGFGTDNAKDDVHQQTQNSIVPVTRTGAITAATTNSTNLAQFQNNNNDWHMADHNTTEQNSAESLLRSALQGKGYSKGLHLQNGIAIIPTQNSIKDEELRRALFSPEQDTLAFADSTLSAPIFDETTSGIVSPPITHQPTQTSQSTNPTNSNNNCNSNTSNNTNHSTTAGIIVDDMFLSLESAFSDDFEKIKRIATEVQQFCTGNDYPEVIMEISTPMPPQQHQNSTSQQTLQIQQPPQPPPPPQPLQPEVTTSNSTPTSTVTKTTTKKYKRSSMNNNNNNNLTNNNNNNNINNNNNNTTNNNNNSPTQCNGQRKERSLHYCSICSKGFKDKYSVNVHIRTHTGEKPFACSLCGKSFRQKAHLAKHYQTHLAQKSNGNVVKSGKQSQASSSRPQAQQSQQQQQPPQRQISTNSNNSNSSCSLPTANGLLANR